MTGLISTTGLQFRDWSADYRFFERERFDPCKLFDLIRQQMQKELEPTSPLIVAMDDTISQKSGRQIPGTSWRRDSMSPAFHPNLVWGRRFIQVSAMLPSSARDLPGRAIPIALAHAPTPRRPSKKASPEEWDQYRHECRTQSLSHQGVGCLQALSQRMSEDDEPDRPLWACVDGSYTNRFVLKELPPNTTLIGRIRRDAKLHPLPDPVADRASGRPRLYGKKVITPEQILGDADTHWRTADVYAAGKLHHMRYKTMTPLLWRAAGPDLPLRVLAIPPLRYRPTKRSKLMYRRPAFLICTNPDIPPDEILRAYVSRWDIEVNFRDEKQIMGFDDAQLRTPSSAVTAPALAVAAYALLLLAAARAFGVNGAPTALPPPKWRSSSPKRRASANDLLNQLRFEVWGRAINGQDFFSFASPTLPTTNTHKPHASLASSVFYAQRGA